MNCFAVHRFVRPQLREINHTSAIWLHSFLFLLVFFDSQARISLLGEVDRASPVDNQWRRGAAIAGFRTCCSEAGSSCVKFPPNRELSEPIGRLGHPCSYHQGYAPEDDPGSFIGEDWGEGALGVEAFQEPTENHNDCVDNDNYRVPLISQEQAYANHGLQMNQVAASIDDPGTTAPLPTRETRWGPPGGSQEQGPSPCRATPGDTRR